MRRLLPVVMLAALVAALVAAAAPAHRLPGAQRCPVLSGASAFNKRVDSWKVAQNSGKLIRAIGDKPVHPDFGARFEGTTIGIPYDVVRRSTKRTKVSFDYADESDRVGYPLTSAAQVESGSDHHSLLVDRDACKLYELFGVERRRGGWHAGSGAVFNLRKGDFQRKTGFTSADAAGLPILPGLARPEDIKGLDHALRFTLPKTRRAYVSPATHYASDSTNSSLMPMGTRIRLKRRFSLRGLGPQARAIARGLQRYGALLADNGSPMYLSGVPSQRWSNDDLHDLNKLGASDFEVVVPR